jgi:TPR repeat protein
MDPEARRRACVAFRVKLSRDTGANLTAADCEELLETTFMRVGGPVGGEEVSVQSDPGLFFTTIGAAIEAHQTVVVPDHLKVAWFCYREAAEVHKHPAGTGRLAECYDAGHGVMEDPAQAAVWYQKAAVLGDVPSKATLGTMLKNGDARAGVATDAARGFALLREAADLGYDFALIQIAECYLKGEGVEQDAARGVSLLRQVINQDEDAVMKASAEAGLAVCYMEGNGVEIDIAQSAMWCQRAADGGDATAIEMLPVIRSCDLCFATLARRHCKRCRTVRYCNAACQAAHWHRETDSHKGHCRRAADGGASTSTGA